MERIILHIDFDSFFASVEQQYRPELRNKPIGVTATNGRNCIIAASREAKRLGIKSPSRVFEAQQLCPSLQVVPANFTNYFAISKKFLNICKDYTPYVELFSMDEVFMDISKTVHLFKNVDWIVKTIQQRIALEIGEYITVSVGISYNKALAKMASGLEKPNGLVYINRDNLETIYKKSPLTAVCGIGDRTALRLRKLGIYTLFQLRNIPFYVLLGEFGKVGAQFLKNIGLGIDTREVVPYTQAPSVKSVGRNYCLPKNEYDQRIVLQNMYELSEEVAIKLRRLNKKARTVGIGLQGSFSVYSHKTQEHATDSGKDIFETCISILRASPDLIGASREAFLNSSRLLSNNSIYVRQISIWTGNLIDKEAIPIPLFKEDRRKERLVRAIDTINTRFGHHTIRNGFLLYADKLTTVPNGWMGDRYERTQLAETSL